MAFKAIAMYGCFVKKGPLETCKLQERSSHMFTLQPATRTAKDITNPQSLANNFLEEILRVQPRNAECPSSSKHSKHARHFF